jgi:hypothetical protein
MDDPARCDSMRPALKAFADRFEPETIARQWLALIDDLMNTGK